MCAKYDFNIWQWHSLIEFWNIITTLYVTRAISLRGKTIKQLKNVWCVWFPTLVANSNKRFLLSMYKYFDVGLVGNKVTIIHKINWAPALLTNFKLFVFPSYLYLRIDKKNLICFKSLCYFSFIGHINFG